MRLIQENVSDALTTINLMFLKHHSLSAQTALKDVQHVVVLHDQELSLWCRDNADFKEVARSNTDAKESGRYTLLKQVSHIPVLLVSILQPVFDQALPLVDLMADIAQLKEQLLLLQSNKMQLPKSHAIDNIVARSLWFIDQLKTGLEKNVIERLLMIYLKEICEDINSNSNLAAEAQLKSLQVVERWLDEHMLALKSTRVIIVAPHGPRNGLIEQQYFERLYAKHHLLNQADHRIFYVEMLPKDMLKIDIPKDLIRDFLGACELNKRIGQWMFSNSKALFSDVMHEYAGVHLEKLISKHEEPIGKCPLSLFNKK